MADNVEAQVLYLGRWVSKEHFKAFVYKADDKKLANSYDEFSNLISSGLWRAEPVASIEPETNIVDIKPKRGRKCPSQAKV